ncbi:hypothetical protein FA95DRAFT_1566469 [Auriscalpium vulgare]|uniref:Uncharacterized protein n=1 Tax=Auriscalpium vulgare TaxID=40419 RepID=A0ACB8R8U2_9AGAM|nr:hypothetical protein FA95DRAFT_1566469 [Auriscalpium vulgare]
MMPSVPESIPGSISENNENLDDNTSSTSNALSLSFGNRAFETSRPHIGVAESALSMSSPSTSSEMSFKTTNSVASYKTRVNQTIASWGDAFQPGRNTSMDATPAIRSLHSLLCSNISYGVNHLPSADSVRDRHGFDSVPCPLHKFTERATDPAITAGSHMKLYSDQFPWPVVVVLVPRELPYLPGVMTDQITTLDVLYAVHNTLKIPVTPAEWKTLGDGGKEQRRIAAAYQSRCSHNGGWDKGVLRSDWLGRWPCLTGIRLEIDASQNRVWKMEFTYQGM